MSLSEINCIWEFTLLKFNLKNNVSFSTSTLHKQKKILICLIFVTKSPLIQTKEIVEKWGKGKSIARCNTTQKVKGFGVGAAFTQRALSLEVQPGTEEVRMWWFTSVIQVLRRWEDQNSEVIFGDRAKLRPAWVPRDCSFHYCDICPWWWSCSDVPTEPSHHWQPWALAVATQ